jgi:hypothetical protein
MKGLEKARIKRIRLSSFGMKCPLLDIQELFDDCINDNPSFENRFDFGYTVPGQYLPSFNVKDELDARHNPRVLSMYNGISGVSNLRKETNIGGSLSYFFKDGIFSDAKVMIYPHVVHMDKALSREWKVPDTFRTLRPRYNHLSEVVDSLATTEISYGGYRIELTCHGGNIASNLIKYDPVNNLSVKKVYQEMNREPLITRITRDAFIANCANSIASFEPYSHGRNEYKVPQRSKRYYSDLLNSIGINRDRHPRSSHPWQSDTLWKNPRPESLPWNEHSIEGYRVQVLESDSKLVHFPQPTSTPAADDDVLEQLTEIMNLVKFRKTPKGGMYTFMKKYPPRSWGEFCHPEKVKVGEYILKNYGMNWHLELILNEAVIEPAETGGKRKRETL